MNVIIANNSLILRQILNDILIENGDKVLLMCSSGREVIETADRSKVDLVILGENLSGYSESETVKNLMKKNTVPIILIGNPNSSANKALLNNGLRRIMPKPDMNLINEKPYKAELLNIFKTASQSDKLNYKKIPPDSNSSKIEHIVIGSSTGGPNALKEVLENLPADLNVSISVVQHMEDGHEENFAKWLDKASKLHIRLAKDIDKPKPGEVILGAQGKHLIVKGRAFYYVDGVKINYQKPAVDKLFETAAFEYKKGLVGILLTGMGNDGGQGCVEIIKNGGFTIVQDESTSTVFGMPKKAIELNAASVVLPLGEIAGYLVKLIKKRNMND